MREYPATEKRILDAQRSQRIREAICVNVVVEQKRPADADGTQVAVNIEWREMERPRR